MNVKLKLGDVCLLLDNRISIKQISCKLQPIAKQANLLFADPQVGAGYLQWTLSGTGWIAFPNGTDDQRSVVAQLYKERKSLMQNSLQGSVLKDLVFTVPSDDFIFFRQDGDKWEIALTAWGYKYPDRPASSELDTWISKHELQKVNIAFLWAGQKQPNFGFKLSGHIRSTSSDGCMHVDGLLPVGKVYTIETLVGRSFELIVEKGKSDYIFDLTQYFQVDVSIYQDQLPLSGYNCEVEFGGEVKHLLTDSSGHTSVKLPFVGDHSGQISASQPLCIATCGDETQQKTPSNNGEIISFIFNLQSTIQQPPPPTINKSLRVKVEVYSDGKPLSGKESEVFCYGISKVLTTNDNGEVFFDVPTNETATDVLSGDKPICEVLCDGKRQTKAIDEDTTDLVFVFDLSPVHEEIKEIEFVQIQLKDYSGAPLIDMPFYITTKKKGRIQLQTDKEGNCKLPKEWFTPKEKIQVDFIVSEEYQTTHDIHY